MGSQTVASEATGVLQQADTSTTSTARGTEKEVQRPEASPDRGEMVLPGRLLQRSWGHLRKSWSHTRHSLAARKQEKAERKDGKYPVLAPLLPPSPASASRWLHLPRSQNITKNKTLWWRKIEGDHEDLEDWRHLIKVGSEDRTKLRWACVDRWVLLLKDVSR